MLAGVMIPARHFNGGSEEYGSPSRLMDGQNHQNHQNEAPHIFGDEEFDTRSVSENLDQMASGDEHDDNPSLKKKRYHRHTQQQILELETFFKQCPHPDDRQRKELGHTLGLEPLQIKFWFQNKRTQVKAKDERTCNQVLRAENDRLRAENIHYKEALTSASCLSCGGPAALGEMSFDEHQLRAENLRLGMQIDRIMGVAAKYGGKSVMSHPLINVSTLSRSPGDLGSRMGELMKTVSGTSDVEKPLIIDLAVSAMEELLMVAQAGEPLWYSGFNIAGDILNQEEYVQIFPREEASKNMGWSREASRETAVVMMSPMSLVEILMDVNEWTAMFSSIVSRAVTMEVLSTGVAGNYNGALQVMLADYQVPSPFVPTRGSLFVRYCKQHQDRTWAVVDASLDSPQPHSTKCRRRPSGCLIQEMSNGHSKVTWVEHVEVDDRSVHSLYKMVINSGLAFGAKRWVATLKRQCERLASAMDHTFPADDIGTVIAPEGRKSLLKLAERMVISFCSGVSGSDANNWSHVSDANKENIRISMKKCVDDPARPSGYVITAAISLWLPVITWRLFNFLRDETNRTEWDILSNNSIIKEVFHIANGPEQGNCVSLLGVDNKNDILILQESCFNTTGSYVIYAPVDCHAMSLIFHGGDSEYVALLPSGFAVLPDGPCEVQGEVIGELGSGGSLLTIAFQILVDSPENSELALRSVATVNNLITCTIDKIKAAVLGEVFNESSLA